MGIRCAGVGIFNGGWGGGSKIRIKIKRVFRCAGVLNGPWARGKGGLGRGVVRGRGGRVCGGGLGAEIRMRLLTSSPTFEEDLGAGVAVFGELEAFLGDVEHGLGAGIAVEEELAAEGIIEDGLEHLEGGGGVVGAGEEDKSFLEQGLEAFGGEIEIVPVEEGQELFLGGVELVFEEPAFALALDFLFGDVGAELFFDAFADFEVGDAIVMPPGEDLVFLGLGEGLEFEDWFLGAHSFNSEFRF